MKYLSSILSLYILILIAVPCIDAPIDEDTQHIELTSSNSHSHQHHTDQCSPLCTCQCCASPLVYTENLIQLSNFTFAQEVQSSYKSIFSTSCISPIWQPPKSI